MQVYWWAAGRVEVKEAEVWGLKAENSCRLVYVGDDGDVYESGGVDNSRRLTFGWSDSRTPDRLYYVWPSFSPDGSCVACFGVRTGEYPEAGLYTVNGDGVCMDEIWRMNEAAPVCESWSFDSKHIALLLQSSDELSLEIASIDRPGNAVNIDKGAPLFWSWSPSESIIAVHTGGSRSLYDEARLTLYDVADKIREVDQLVPGEFRTPTWSPDGSLLAYVDASERGQEMLSFYNLATSVRQPIETVNGQTVMLWSPDGKMLAVSEAHGDSPHIYAGLRIIDRDSGLIHRISDKELVSFFWSPCSQRIICVAFDERAGMSWSVLDFSGHHRLLPASFYPSREFVYFCWFFDQFVETHPLISPDGKHLVFSGHVTQAGADSDDATSVYLTPLSGDAVVERVAAGHFACWDSKMRSNDNTTKTGMVAA